MTGSALHLIRPYGFFLDEKSLKRSGLDYWHKLDVNEYGNFSEFEQKFPHGSFWFVETSGGKFYSDAAFCSGDFLIFGSETTGLPEEILQKYSERVIRIPMTGGTSHSERSLNLSVAVGIVLYEALRQTGFN
jgi:tRNA (cytidine/uridine-2'-O-)-methyltransferase